MQNYLVPCDTSHIICIDERPREENVSGVHMPGAIYGIIDALKIIQNISEDTAWEQVIKAKIPTDAHTDDHHNGKDEALGCGYAGLQSVPSADRFNRAKAAGGMILRYSGTHRPKHAIIVYRKDMTVDQKAAWNDNSASFVFDYWAALEIGAKLGINQKKFANQLERQFKQTVTTLSGITEFSFAR